MSAPDQSRRVAGLLSHAAAANRFRVVALNAVARGEATLTPAERERLVAAERRIAELLEALQGEARPRSRVVTMEQVAAQREALPRALVEGYEVLFCRAYGSDPAVGVGDSNVIRGIGKNEARVTTGTPEGRGGHASPATKKFGQANRNVVQDRRAYEFKIKMDRRLRRLAKELGDFLEGQATVRQVNVCSRCNRLGEDEWKWCPSCGHEMKTEERE